MSGQPKPTPRQAFDDNIADAETLVSIAKALRNKRVRKMRRERRERLGEALDIRRRDWDKLDCIESEDLFAIFQPTSRLSRADLDESSLRPLLRQALVAGCAAIETFVGDRVMQRLGDALAADPPPARLLDLPKLASPSPSQIGILLSTVGERDVWKRVDSRRGVNKGVSERALERIYERRNRIAHTGDRSGRGRAAITVKEVEDDLACIVSVVNAIDKETAPT